MVAAGAELVIASPAGRWPRRSWRSSPRGLSCTCSGTSPLAGMGGGLAWERLLAAVLVVLAVFATASLPALAVASLALAVLGGLAAFETIGRMRREAPQRG